MQKVISQTKAFQATAKAVKPLVLKAKDIDFDLYRKTIFECISLIQSLKNGPIF